MDELMRPKPDGDETARQFLLAPVAHCAETSLNPAAPRPAFPGCKRMGPFTVVPPAVRSGSGATCRLVPRKTLDRRTYRNGSSGNLVIELVQDVYRACDKE